MNMIGESLRMTNRSPNLREKYLDGEKLFRKYYEMGESRSFALLAEWATLEGMKSSKGQIPTPMGVWKAMWRWASLKANVETAWTIVWENSVQNNITREEWNKQMIRKFIPIAWQHPTNSKKEKFLKENGWI